jgi:hypothetical protein
MQNTGAVTKTCSKFHKENSQVKMQTLPVKLGPRIRGLRGLMRPWHKATSYIKKT